jgi:tetratricopeptide (TPR) repeat protein
VQPPEPGSPEARAEELYKQALEIADEQDPKRLDLLVSAVELDPNSVKYRYSLARAYYYNKDFERSVEQCQKILEIDPRHTNALTIMGSSYFFMREYEKAIDAHEQALKVNPKNYYAQYNLAFAWEFINTDRAIAEWQRYIDMAENEPGQEQYVEQAKANLKKLQ